MSNKFKEEKTVLKINGLRATPFRIALLTYFKKSTTPINTDLIYKKLNKKFDLATVYRNLEIFLEKKIIRKVPLGTSSILYELNDDHHHHIVCQKCGFIEDFSFETDKCEIENLSRQILHRAKNFDKIMEHSFELFGLCYKCKS